MLLGGSETYAKEVRFGTVGVRSSLKPPSGPMLTKDVLSLARVASWTHNAQNDLVIENGFHSQLVSAGSGDVDASV